MTRSCILLVAVAAVGLHAADDVDCSGMKMKALRQWLTARGLRCDGCAEKADYVALCEANHNAPVVPPEEEEIAAVDELLKRQSGGPKVRTPGSGKDADIDELLKSMKGIPGMENIKMFRPEDIDKLAAEGKQDSGSKSAEQWRDELVSFYKTKGVEWTEEKVDAAMKKWRGRERAMMDAVRKKYSKDEL